jgi:hypothetical protein
MPGVVRTNRIASLGNVGTVIIPTGNKLLGTTANTFYSPRRAGEVIQTVSSNTMPTSHISVTSTSETAAGLKVWISPESASSKILVQWWSTMMNGAANALVTVLYRSTDGGSNFTVLTPITGTKYNYGWSYHTIGWGPQKLVFVDRPGTTGNVVYQLRYRNWSSTSTNYLVHQYMEYGWDLTEIAQ